MTSRSRAAARTSFLFRVRAEGTQFAPTGPMTSLRFSAFGVVCAGAFFASPARAQDAPRPDVARASRFQLELAPEIALVRATQGPGLGLSLAGVFAIGERWSLGFRASGAVFSAVVDDAGAPIAAAPLTPTLHRTWPPWSRA
jgi:hypothetical protein